MLTNGKLDNVARCRTSISRTAVTTAYHKLRQVSVLDHRLLLPESNGISISFPLKNVVLHV